MRRRAKLIFMFKVKMVNGVGQGHAAPARKLHRNEGGVASVGLAVGGFLRRLLAGVLICRSRHIRPQLVGMSCRRLLCSIGCGHRRDYEIAQRSLVFLCLLLESLEAGDALSRGGGGGGVLGRQGLAVAAPVRSWKVGLDERHGLSS